VPEADIPCIATQQVPAFCKSYIHKHGEKEGKKEKRGFDKGKSKQKDQEEGRINIPPP
jgi:hypothetical protein